MYYISLCSMKVSYIPFFGAKAKKHLPFFSRFIKKILFLPKVIHKENGCRSSSINPEGLPTGFFFDYALFHKPLVKTYLVVRINHIGG
jgi:hypothetical protein